MLSFLSAFCELSFRQLYSGISIFNFVIEMLIAISQMYFVRVVGKFFMICTLYQWHAIDCLKKPEVPHSVNMHISQLVVYANLLQAIPFLVGCPACLRNFLNLFCELSCSPNQSLFINVSSTSQVRFTIYCYLKLMLGDLWCI